MKKTLKVKSIKSSINKSVKSSSNKSVKSLKSVSNKSMTNSSLTNKIPPDALKGCTANYNNPRHNYKIGKYLTKGGSKNIYTIENVKNMLYVEIDAYSLKNVKEMFEEFCLYVILENQKVLVHAYDWKYEKIRSDLWICSFYIELCDLNLVYKKGWCSSSEENFIISEINQNNILNFIYKIRQLNIIKLPKEHELFKYCSYLKPGKTYYNVDYKPENICIFKSDDSWNIKLLDVGIEYLHEVHKNKLQEILDYSFIMFFSKLLKWCATSKYKKQREIILTATKKLGYISKENIDKMIFVLEKNKYKNIQTPLSTLHWYLCLENESFKEKCKTNIDLRNYIIQLFTKHY